MGKLVMIDDNPLDHFIAKKLIGKTGLFSDCTHITDGREVISSVEENKFNGEQLPDIILLDLNMPEFTGWDFLERFKTMESTLAKNIDIHILSSSIKPEDSMLTRKYPFVKSYLVKPLSADMLAHIHNQSCATN